MRVLGGLLGRILLGLMGGDGNLYRYVGNRPTDRIDPLGTKDTRWPANGSVTNNSSQPVIILNSTDTGDYLETLQHGQATPDSIGRSKDADGVWVCRNNKWAFYEVSVGNIQWHNTISVRLPTTVGISVPVPVPFPKDATIGDVIVTDSLVRDRGGRILSPGLPQNRGRQSSNTPPGGSSDCSCLDRTVQQYPDASVWRPVLPGDHWRGSLLEDIINGIEGQVDQIKTKIINDLKNLGYPSDY
jgi:hypothetical protein